MVRMGDWTWKYGSARERETRSLTASVPSPPPPFLPPAFPSLLLSFTLLLLLLAALPARAQDTTRAPADTVRADTTLRDTLLRDTIRRDTATVDTLQRPRRPQLSEEEALDFVVNRPGRAVSERIPARDPVLDATELLAQVPGTFRYDTGGVGWPHGISFLGRPPDQTTLLLGGLPFNDPLTGRPRYDLLPLPFLQPLHTGFAALGRPGAVHAAVRPYSYGRPLTVLRYRSGGFQSIGALHTQRRKVHFFDRPAFAQFTGGYFGRASDNLQFLPGSELRRERRLLGRLRYRRRGWALQLMALHNRRRIGAHEGLALRPGEPVDSVFAGRPLRASQAERRLLRTDLSATLRAQTPLAAAPLTAAAYWTAQTLRYRNPDLTPAQPAVDTVGAETDRYGLHLRQPFSLRSASLGQHALLLEAHAWTDRLSESRVLSDDGARTQLHLSARDSTRLLGARAVLEGGLHAGPVQTYPSARLHLVRPARDSTLHLFAEAQLSGQPVSWIEAEGLGTLVEPLPDGRTPGPVLSARAGVQAQLGPVQTRLALFAERTTDRLYLRALDGLATARARVADGVSQRAGALLSARWRARAERGFYATGAATAFLDPSEVPFHAPAAPSVPQAHGRARLGARYAFFTGDLDVDAYAEGRFWSQMTSRSLHGPTGRLVLPPPGSPVLGPAGVLDLHAEVQIRTATLFFSYENALSGTAVQTGTLTVPLYPLPQQHFRFGVYWPIFN